MSFFKHLGHFSLVALFAINSLTSNLAIASEDDKVLLGAIHKYGVTKCDSFILEHGKLKDNWHFDISRHPKLNNENFSEVTIQQVAGSQGDTIKIAQTYIQTPSACYLLELSTVTFSGHCSDNDNIDQNSWFVKDEMEGLDYKKYQNKGGVDLFAKEISVGNFNACVIEYQVRRSSKISK